LKANKIKQKYFLAFEIMNLPFIFHRKADLKVNDGKHGFIENL
jgi:hypothetical protein